MSYSIKSNIINNDMIYGYFLEKDSLELPIKEEYLTEALELTKSLQDEIIEINTNNNRLLFKTCCTPKIAISQYEDMPGITINLIFSGNLL